MSTPSSEAPARPFVRATVVRAQEPASARPGDSAVVLPDGTIDGFVGGQCSVEAVRSTALESLRTREAVLLRVLPDHGPAFPDSPGAVVVVNPCLSGGALEIYLEPMLPTSVVRVVGDSPTARALADLAPTVGFPVCGEDDATLPGSLLAVVVATHGGDEVGAVRAALADGAGFVGIVSSRTRGRAVLVELSAAGLTDDELARVHPHVGVDIGARTPQEIAVAIVAALVRAVRVDGARPLEPSDEVAEPVTAVDPVCGMTVVVHDGTPHAVVDGEHVWFCCPGCRDAHLAAAAPGSA
ncbi:XdhC family protein [Phycicoccus sp. CSK15P-2]|uniref:XdhC family protein n=1 Tax=Phycicoccus sp. CSK15P-2 TaxID=2807627 RepID=UPI0019510827|nr:XdhC family protein [Phycicoccus sp. CSK15P-2]MBM6403548.1 XdhC family protein [Phycicoccus sp. CSK15P-2]